MKIAFIVDQFPSLSETFILNQITGLMDRGHNVDIYASQVGSRNKMNSDVETYKLLDRTFYFVVPGLKARLLKLPGILLTQAGKKPGVLLRALNVFKYNPDQHGDQGIPLRLFYSALPLLNKSAYDIIHCHYGRNGLKGAMLQEIGAIQGKLLTTFHGHDVNVYPQLYGKTVYQLLFQRGDLYTVNTNFTGKQAIALGCPEDKIVKLPVGVNLSKYHYQERILNPGDPVKIITVARLVEKKGIEYAIRAVVEVVKQHPHLIYQIVGEGPLRSSLESLIQTLGLSQHVKLLGQMTQDEVRQLYRDSHLLILSSVTAKDGDMEGQGLVLQEAQAMGLPVLSTHHNGIPDGVLDGESGFLVPERDVEALAERLKDLVEHPQMWSCLGRAGRAYVEKQYDIHNLNDRLVEIYQRVLA